MKNILLLFLVFLVSCGGGSDPSPTTTDPQITTVPGLSENSGTDINLYKLDPLKIREASVILPADSTTTLQEVQQSAIFSLFRTPYSGSFNEGNIDNALVITLKVLNIPNRTRVPYIISGINVEDIESMVLNGASMPPALAGYFDLGSQGAVGFANLVLIFKSDQTTEGAETLSLRLGTGWTNVDALTVTATINDTSTTPVPPVVPDPTYTLTKTPAGSIDEGLLSSPVTITLNTTGLERGTAVPWTISGSFITVADIESMVVNGTPQIPSLTGQFIVNSGGSTTMVLTFKADKFTEGAETLVLGLPTVPGTPTVSITINDTSTTAATLVDTTNPIISITSVYNFVANSSMNVEGVAVDNVGIRSVTWINRIEGVIVNQGSASLTQFGNYATWTTTIPLQLGNNNIEILATDTNGRTGYEIIVVSGSVAMVSGQNSYEADPWAIEETEMVASQSVEMGDSDLASMVTSQPTSYVGDPTTHIEQMRLQAERVHRFTQLGIDSDKVISLASLGIPEPPAEVHPCNKGYYLHLHHATLPNIKFKLDGDWWLLASATSRIATDPNKVHFYWAKQIGDTSLGLHDTGIQTENSQLKLGTIDAKLDLGWAVVPYSYAMYVGISPLPISRNEICEV